MNEKIYCKSGGCSAKLGAKKLSHILEKIDSYKDSHVLVGFDSRDDAAVYQIDENHAFVSTSSQEALSNRSTACAVPSSRWRRITTSRIARR